MAQPRTNASSAQPLAWQTIATVLLIVHLFCLGLGLAVNAGGGKSLLAPALFRVPVARDYLRLLWMDVGYDFYIASPLPEDGTHRLQLSADEQSSAADIEGLPAEMPLADLQPRIRRQRYQQLAYHVAFLDELYADNSDVRTELPLALADRWLRELDAPHAEYKLTCTRDPAKRLPKAIERAPAKIREGGSRADGPATYEKQTVTVYLVWNPEENRYQGSRAEPEGQVSHVVRAKPAEDSSNSEDDGEPASAGGGAKLDDAAEDPEVGGLPDIPAPLETNDNGNTDEAN
jgi:hypothetical protein